MFLIYRIKMLLSGLAVIERIAEDFFAHAGFFQRAHHRQAQHKAGNRLAQRDLSGVDQKDRQAETCLLYTSDAADE